MRVFTSIYLLLLGYIITAVVFWEMSLQKLSGRIYAQEVITLKSRIDSVSTPLEYSAELASRKQELDRRTYQYIGEGSTFIVVILIGAFVVYRSVKRRIEVSRQQNNFMLAVTHELKTPIAAIKLNLQTIGKHKLDEGKQGQLLDRSVKEANRLNDLCNNILYASQLEGGTYKQSVEQFSLSDMVEDALEEYSARYPQRFADDVAGGCHITGDRTMILMSVNNLLENAVKYTPADKPITVTLEKVDNKAVLTVADLGAGIPDSEKKKVFQKFYRVGNEETRKSKGTGLGLYLVQRVIHKNHGQITVKDNQPSGAVFEIRLPLSK